MTRRPLPRSLDPIHNESLAGYVLRLAHRLDLSPRDVYRAIGLVTRPAASVSAIYLLRIDADLAQRIAESTRLAPGEVKNLTYEGLRGIYPPVDTRASTAGKGRYSTLFNGRWLFTDATRYCPECLAGDGSMIQAIHGGSWNKLWRLIPVFACVPHRRLLQSHCPACGQPALANNPPSTSQIIPAPALYGLHPAACRSQTEDGNPCPGRFDAEQDQSPSAEFELGDIDWLLRLQRSFQALLASTDPDAPAARSVGRNVTAATYFTDLRLITATINAALYRAHDTGAVLPHGSGRARRLRARIMRHIERELHRDKADQTSRRNHLASGFRSPIPLEPVVCASLLALASDMLTAPDPSAVAVRIKALFGGTLPHNQEAVLRGWRKSNMPLSVGLQEAIDLTREKRRTINNTARNFDRLQRLVPELSDSLAFVAENVPQYLPYAWWDEHFEQRGDAPEREQRRMAAAVLMAAVENCPVREAAKFLGHTMRTMWNPSAWFAVMDDDYTSRYRQSIENLALHLNERSRHPNYMRRRGMLNNWALDQPSWQSITDGLLPRNGAPPDLGDEKRLVCALFVWTRATEGDHLLAPMTLAHSISPRPWAWHALVHPHPGSYYLELARRLTEYANYLGDQIDLMRQ